MQTARRTRSSAPAQPQQYPPGARLLVRGELWMARSARPTKTGALEVHVTGLSELVRNRDAIFLTDLDDVKLLDPRETELVADDSPGYRRSKLYLESLLRQTPPTEPRVVVGHKAAMNHAPYQLVPAMKALAQPRPRILIADGVGLGKTLEVGILLSELIRRDRGRRILVVALKSVLEQFQQELWARFTIPLVRLDSEGISRVQRRIPANHNPFYYYDRVIISIDTLKRDEKYRRYLEQCHWDVTVIDECQHVAQRGRAGTNQKSDRSRLAELLATTCDALLMTSATPHDGRPESFASLLNLLEPTAVADPSSYTAEDIKGLYVRRFKKDIAGETRGQFSERDPRRHEIPASAAEDAVFERLARVEFATLDRGTTGGVLFRTLLLKSFLSSPEALIQTLDERIKKLDKQTPGAAVTKDLQLLRELRELAAVAEKRGTSKLARLMEVLRKMGVGPGSSERVVIFTERIATLNMLAEAVRRELKLPDNAVETFHGTLDDLTQQQRVKSFGTEKSPVRVLVASDAASEGINLHFFCHRLVHFDTPWSLITLEQRNGRIDRFGQQHRPELHYLLTRPSDPRIQGDLRVLEVLIDKEHQAHKNLGDVRWLMQLGEAELEEQRIATAIEKHEKPESVLPDLDSLDLDDLLAPVSGLEGIPANDGAPSTADAPSIYADDLAYWKEALKELEHAKAIERPEWHDEVQGLTLKAPEDLQQRFAYLPPELQQDDHWHLKLTAQRELVQRALDKAREDTARWPEWQLLWSLHPVAAWIDDRVVANFARHEAPVLRVNEGLATGEAALVMQGINSNGESAPVMVDWFAVRFHRGNQRVQPLAAFAAEVGLGKRLTNDTGGVTLAALEKLREPAVEAAIERMRALREERSQLLKPQLKASNDAVKGWAKQRLARIDRDRQELTRDGRKLRADQEERLRREQEAVERTVAKRSEWIAKRLATSNQPYVRIVAAVVARGGK